MNQAIAQASSSHFRLVLVVGPANSGKTRLLKEFHARKGWPLIALGKELSRRLLPLTVRQRELKCAGIVADIISEKDRDADCLLVDNTDSVFDKSLKINVNGLLSSISRNKVLVWTWQGSIRDGAAVHGMRGHPEYCSLPTSDITVIEMAPTGE